MSFYGYLYLAIFVGVPVAWGIVFFWRARKRRIQAERHRAQILSQIIGYAGEDLKDGDLVWQDPKGLFWRVR